MQDPNFWPLPPPIPTPSSSLPFIIHEDVDDDDSDVAPVVPSKKQFPAPIGSERALSRSLLNNSSSSTASSFGENLENLVPAIPSYARTEFRQCNDSILSTSPTSEAYDVSAEEDSPMLVEGSILAAASGRLAPADILSDVEEYSLDIVAHMRKVEVQKTDKKC